MSPSPNANPNANNLNANYRPGRGAAIAGLAALAVMLAIPPLAPNDFLIHTLCIAMIYAVLAASWDLLFGYGGLVSFGHAGFFGLGAYAGAVLTHQWGLSPWWGPLIGGVAAMLLGLLIGLPTLRLRAVFLALATLAVAESLRVVASNWHDVTRGTLGFSAHRTFFKLSGEAHWSYYMLLAASLVLIGAIYWIANRTRFGLNLRAIRSDEIRAEALGISVVQKKILAFMLGGFFAGTAGGLYAHYMGLVSPTELGPTTTMLVIAMATIGGTGTILGPAAAALVLYVATELLRLAGTVYAQVAIGILLIAFVLFLPDGIAGWIRRRSGQYAVNRAVNHSNTGTP
jgi:branched-chain amino acid transport system permease protein